MSHEITRTDSLFLRAARAWHGLGTIIPADTADRMRWREVAEIAFKRTDGKPGHWDVEERPAGMIDALGNFRVDPASKALARNDSQDLLSIVSKSYAHVGVAQSFAPFDDLVADGILGWETAGSFGGGRRIWVAARILSGAALEIGSGDAVVPFAFLSTGFDGKTPIVAKGTGVRPVCQNTVRAALLDGLASFRVAHRGDAAGKVGAAVQAIDGVRALLEKQADRWRAMAAKPVDDLDLARYVAAVWQRPVAEVIGDGKTIAPMRDWGHIVDAWDRPRGGKLATTDGTAWGLYQAVTQFVSHGSRTTSKTAADRMESAQFNGGHDRMSRAEAIADVLASIGLGRVALTWEDLQTMPTAKVLQVVEAHAAA